MNLFNNPEEAEHLAALRTYHTPKLDELRKLLPQIETSNLIQHMINPGPLMAELTGWTPPAEGLALVYPSPDKMHEIQMTLGAALLAMAEEIDERIPVRAPPRLQDEHGTFGIMPTKNG